MYCFRVYVILCSPLIFNLSKIVLIFSCSFTSLSRPVGLFSFFVVFAINLIGFSYSLRARVRFRICELVPLCVCFQRFFVHFWLYFVHSLVWNSKQEISVEVINESIFQPRFSFCACHLMFSSYEHASNSLKTKIIV